MACDSYSVIVSAHRQEPRSSAPASQLHSISIQHLRPPMCAILSVIGLRVMRRRRRRRLLPRTCRPSVSRSGVVVCRGYPADQTTCHPLSAVLPCKISFRTRSCPSTPSWRPVCLQPFSSRPRSSCFSSSESQHDTRLTKRQPNMHARDAHPVQQARCLAGLFIAKGVLPNLNEEIRQLTQLAKPSDNLFQ